MAKAKTDKTKYGHLILRNAFKKHHQMEGLSAGGDEMNADCILTHHIFYKPEAILKESHYHDDFMQILCFLGTNPENVRDFGGAQLEICLGKEEEKHAIKGPVIMPIPAGVPHGPLVIKKVPKPIIFLEIMLTRRYHNNKEDEKKTMERDAVARAAAGRKDIAPRVAKKMAKEIAAVKKKPASTKTSSTKTSKKTKAAAPRKKK
jgi:hypothetical protein